MSLIGVQEWKRNAENESDQKITTNGWCKPIGFSAIETGQTVDCAVKCPPPIHSLWERVYNFFSHYNILKYNKTTKIDAICESPESPTAVDVSVTTDLVTYDTVAQQTNMSTTSSETAGVSVQTDAPTYDSVTVQTEDCVAEKTKKVDDELAPSNTDTDRPDG